MVRRDFDPTAYLMPRELVLHQEIVIWGRTYLIGRSRLGVDVGLGVFAMETIHVRSTAIEDRPTLFPFCGPMYSATRLEPVIMTVFHLWEIWHLHRSPSHLQVY